MAVAHFAQASRVMDKSTQTCDLAGTPSLSESKGQSYDAEGAACYVNLGQDSETEPVAYMGFFDIRATLRSPTKSSWTTLRRRVLVVAIRCFVLL